MDNLISIIIAFVLGGTLPIAVVIIFIILNPEKIEIWISIISKIFSNIFTKIASFRKNYIKFDLQGRVNQFVKEIGHKIPSLSEYRLNFEWIDSDKIDRKSFLDRNKVILRIKKDDPHDENFVIGAFSFVSHCLLIPIKRHVNDAQKISIDTFVTAELIKKEKPQIFNFFAEKYLHPNINDKKRSDYFSNYQIINEHGLFFEVLLQELDYIGRKIVTAASRHLLINEFDAIVDFLKGTANRKVGDDSDLYFNGQYSKMLIIIIGKSLKVKNTQIYVDYLQKETSRRDVETIYAIGPAQKQKSIEEVFKLFNTNYGIFHCGSSAAIINYSDGSKKNINQYFCILRRENNNKVY